MRGKTTVINDVIQMNNFLCNYKLSALENSNCHQIATVWWSITSCFAQLLAGIMRTPPVG